MQVRRCLHAGCISAGPMQSALLRPVAHRRLQCLEAFSIFIYLMAGFPRAMPGTASVPVVYQHRPLPDCSGRVFFFVPVLSFVLHRQAGLGTCKVWILSPVISGQDQGHGTPGHPTIYTSKLIPHG